MVYFINIGSNRGDRRLHLSRAVRKVSELFGDYLLSHAVETAPWGYESSAPFLNIGMAFESTRDPIDVLRELQRIEREISPSPHRNADGSYRDRDIDIDIVAIDEQVIDTPELKVPHPHLAQREFFLRPMEEIAPAWRHPQTAQTPTAMLHHLPTSPKPKEGEIINKRKI